ncbi:MAG TPA: N-acetylglucosamine-6-phosphate deacetylase [Thermoplasmataceae archaeon]|nr:N-acetylglucosamine-6-phosphate deacetylase [Thermoplasmataceae archaeon]
MSDLAIKVGKLVSARKSLDNAVISVENGKVTGIKRSTEPINGLDYSNLIALPGFIDVHTHGHYGFDAESSKDSEILEWAGRLPETGVTSFIPTLVSLPLPSIYKQFDRYRSIMGKSGDFGARILGIRCEGPYLSREKKGAHNERYLRVPSTNELQEFFTKGKGVLRIIDMALEISSMENVLAIAKKFGVQVSLGHSNAPYWIASRALESGVSLLTHFYNAMSPLNHHDVGVVGAGFLSRTAYIELIADLHHVSREAIDILVRMRGIRSLILITDSLSIGDSDVHEGNLGGLKINEHDGVAWIDGTNTIAGSVLTMNRAVKNMVTLGYGLDELAYALSYNQSRFLGIAGLGAISEGSFADICFLDDKLNVVSTMINGKIVYSNY